MHAPISCTRMINVIQHDIAGSPDRLRGRFQRLPLATALRRCPATERYAKPETARNHVILTPHQCNEEIKRRNGGEPVRGAPRDDFETTGMTRPIKRRFEEKASGEEYLHKDAWAVVRAVRSQLSAIEAIEALLAQEITARESRRVKAALQLAPGHHQDAVRLSRSSTRSTATGSSSSHSSTSSIAMKSSTSSACPAVAVPGPARAPSGGCRAVYKWLASA